LPALHHAAPGDHLLLHANASPCENPHRDYSAPVRQLNPRPPRVTQPALGTATLSPQSGFPPADGRDHGRPCPRPAVPDVEARDSGGDETGAPAVPATPQDVRGPRRAPGNPRPSGSREGVPDQLRRAGRDGLPPDRQRIRPQIREGRPRAADPVRLGPSSPREGREAGGEGARQGRTRRLEGPPAAPAPGPERPAVRSPL